MGVVRTWACELRLGRSRARGIEWLISRRAVVGHGLGHSRASVRMWFQGLAAGSECEALALLVYRASRIRRPGCVAGLCHRRCGCGSWVEALVRRVEVVGQGLRCLCCRAWVLVREGSCECSALVKMLGLRAGDSGRWPGCPGHRAGADVRAERRVQRGGKNRQWPRYRDAEPAGNNGGH